MQEAQPIVGESEPGTNAFVASDLGLAAGVFLTMLVGLTAALVGSAFLFADLDVLWHEGRIERLARFDLFLVLIAAYTSAATLVAQRGAGRDFRALRDVVDTPKAEWNAWQPRFLDRRAGWRSALLGAIVGLGVQRLGSVFGSTSPSSSGWGWSSGLRC